MRLFFLLLLIPLSINVFAQKFDYPVIDIEPVESIAFYSLRYQQDSLNPNFIMQEDMLLLIGKRTSLFTSVGSYTLDTLIRNISSREEYQKYLLNPNKPYTRTRFQSKILKNFLEETLTCLDYVIGGNYKYEENLDFLNWELSSDTATISGFKTQKAICNFGGRIWIAWFCSGIPYNDGPYKFSGLPGLIIKIHDSRLHYLYELESLERLNYKLMIDYRDKDFIETTKLGFFSAKDAFRNDIINRAKAAGLSKESQQTVAQNMAMRNNPIELKRK